jgi:hypothetical protein
MRQGICLANYLWFEGRDAMPDLYMAVCSANNFPSVVRLDHLQHVLHHHLVQFTLQFVVGLLCLVERH